MVKKTIAIQETNVEIQNKQDSLNLQQFTLRVRVALRDVLKEISVEKADSSDLFGAVRQLSTNHFVVDINEELYPYYLETLLKREFYNRGLEENFQYGIYDCFSDSIVYTNAIVYNKSLDPTVKSGYIEMDSTSQGKLPKLKWKNDGHYFTVFFQILSTKKLKQRTTFLVLLFIS